MRTKVAEMLGVEFPICAFSHCRDVVAAVSNAGGFGILGAVAHSPKRLESELTWIEEQSGGKPYGVDLLLPPQYVGAEQGGIDTKQARELLPEVHREFVDDLLVRCGTGEVSTMVLVPEAVDAVAPVPVLAAGAEFIDAVELLDDVVDQ